MRLKAMLLCLVLAALAPVTAAHAQRPPTAGEWELLGEQTVAFQVDNDSIKVNQNEEWFRNRAYRRLRFVAEGNDVNLILIRVIYLNDYVEELQVGKVIRRGGQLLVDLRGERSFVKQIDMRYRSNLGLSIGPSGIKLQQAVVKVYGERVQRRFEPPVPPSPSPFVGAGWNEIDSQRFDRRLERVVLRAPRGTGRIGQIKLKALDEPVQVRSLNIRFRNGETQVVRVGQRLEQGEETRPIDLEGVQRFLDTVTVNFEPRRRPGQAGLTLLGAPRPGGAADGPPDDRYAGRGWVPLGEQTVGFGIDRDVINVGQSEEWFRERAFKALHFIAERNEIHMMSVRVVYLNGFDEEIRIDRLIPVGSDLAVDLPGERSYIRQIEMTYRSRPSFRGQAVVKVFGEPVRR